MASCMFRIVFTVISCFCLTDAKIELPSFEKLLRNYPGYRHHSGRFTHNKVIKMVGVDKKRMAHDTSALRMSVALNKAGGDHSLGTELIQLSTHGRDSLLGKNGLQYIYDPIAFGPFLVDKYGYPTVSKVHMFDPVETKKNFWGKQGIVQVITYTKHGNFPKGHIGLWNCDHFHQTPDWIFGHSLITVEFWESPDSDCSHMQRSLYEYSASTVNVVKRQMLKEKRKKAKNMRKINLHKLKFRHHKHSRK